MSKSDLVLLAYIFLIVPAMLVGFVFARRKMFVPYHKLTMTTITIVNWILIILVMAVTYSRDVEPQVPQHLNYSAVFIPSLHLLFGLVAQLIASYLVIRMWFERVLPDWIKVKNIKIYMRTTLALWLLTALLGLTTWAVFYRDFLSSPPVAVAAPNAAANTFTVRMISGNQFDPPDLTISAGTTVHFINADSKPHTVTADDDSFTSKELKNGQTFDYTFNKPGDIPYYCDYHGDKGHVGMAAVIHVTGGTGTQAAIAPVQTKEAAPVQTQAATPAQTKEVAPVQTKEATSVSTVNATSAPGTTQAATQGATQGSAQIATQVVTRVATQASSVVVSLIDDAFEPKTLTIPVGTTIHFVNNGKHKHTVTADDDSFDSGQMNKGATFDQRFNKLGDVPLYCTNHGEKGGKGMAMVVKVVAAGAATQSSAATAALVQTKDATSAPVQTKDATLAPVQTKDATNAAAQTKDATAAPAKTQEATQPATAQAASSKMVQALKPLVVSADDTPGKIGYVPGAQGQMAIITAQAKIADDALRLGHLEDAQAAAEAILNTIDGAGKDRDQDGKVNTPGDGFGLKPYIFGINETTSEVSSAADVTQPARDAMTTIQTTGRDALKDLQKVTQQAQALLDAKTLVDARKVGPLLSTAIATLDKDVSGIIHTAALLNMPGSTITETPTTR